MFNFIAFLGQFGSVVSSYFTFLRWVIFMNFIITLLIASLVIIPEVHFFIKKKLLIK